ncbi:MAG TPA: hypothetical protein ENK32_02900 [Anaerolineae bacterium]|nr:hypothetical protein [Anaerolineae bacterium]
MFVVYHLLRRAFLVAAALLLGLGAAAWLWTLPAAAEPAVPYVPLYVDTTIDSNDAAYQQCTAAANDCSLRGALSLANANAPTLYGLRLPAGYLTLTLAGSGEDGNTTGDLDVAANANVIVIGDDAGSVIQAGANASGGIDRVFHVFGRLELRNVTVQYGRVAGFGGGILNTGALTLTDASLFANTAVGSRGGGLYVDGNGQAAITNGQIVSNTAGAAGGGLGIGAGLVAISGAQILSNSAAPGGNGGGAFVAAAVSRLQASNVLFQGNQAQRGGGLFVESGSAALTGTQFTANDAGYGGGIHLNQPTARLTATNVTLRENAAAQDGGGARIHQGTAVLTGSQVINNSGGANGGGLYVNLSGAALHLSGSSVQGNTASNGGGVFINQGAAVLTNSQVVSNGGSANGGGIYLNQSPAALTGVNSLWRQNSAVNGGGVFINQGTAVLTNSQILGNSAQTGDGGGLFLYQSGAVLTMTGVHLLDNRTTTAGGRGGGIFAANGQMQIGDGCIVNNSDDAIVVYGAGKQATDNWWGAADGPAGGGPGSGDSVSGSVDYSGFKTAPPAGCPDRLLPSADAGAPQTVFLEESVTLDGAASADPAGNGLSYTWAQSGGAPVALFTPTLSRTAFIAPGAAGVLTFTLSVTDGYRMDTAVTTVTVTDTRRIYLPVILSGASSGSALPAGQRPFR